MACLQSLDTDALEIQAAAPRAPGIGASNLLYIISIRSVAYHYHYSSSADYGDVLMCVLTSSLQLSPHTTFRSGEGVGRFRVAQTCSESRD